MKQLLFSLTSRDFEFQTFCTGGNGGQDLDRRVDEMMADQNLLVEFV